jgi:hypothetical protein
MGDIADRRRVLLLGLVWVIAAAAAVAVASLAARRSPSHAAAVFAHAGEPTAISVHAVSENGDFHRTGDHRPRLDSPPPDKLIPQPIEADALDSGRTRAEALSANLLSPADVIPLPDSAMRFFLYEADEIEAVLAECAACMQAAVVDAHDWNWKHSAELWTWTQMRRHPLRTLEPSLASAFFIPTCAVVGQAIPRNRSACPWHTWPERINAAVERFGLIQANRSNHIYITTRYTIEKSVGKAMFNRIVQGSVRIGTVDHEFSRRWCGETCDRLAVMVPYQINAVLLERALVTQGIRPTRERSRDIVFVGTIDVIANRPTRKLMQQCLNRIQWEQEGLRAEIRAPWPNPEGYSELYPSAMLDGKVCLIPSGDSPASQRFFEAIGMCDDDDDDDGVMV